jgi:hypothetical protein
MDIKPLLGIATNEQTTDSTDDDLVDNIMGKFDVDFDTLCVHVAEHKHKELKAEGKHPHHQPTKQTANPVVAPPGDVRRLLGDKRSKLLAVLLTK